MRQAVVLRRAHAHGTAVARASGRGESRGGSGCDDSPAVPFKLSTSRRGSYENPQPGTTAQDVPSAAARVGVSFAAGTTQVELAGRGLALSDGAIRAALEVELDGDAPTELLLVTQDPQGQPVLAHTRQGDRGWALPQPIAGAVGEGPCTLQAASFELLDGNYAVARADLECTTPEAAAGAGAEPTGALPGPANPPAPDGPLEPATATPAPAAAAAGTVPAAAGAAAARRERQLWILALEATPRLVERVATAVPADNRALQVTAKLQSRDLDGDGHPDLVLGLDARGGERPEAHVDIELLSRAGGLSPSGREPEATLLALADRAKAERKGNAARAGETARQVAALHGALCRESGTALVRIGGVQGVVCGASLAAGRAASVLAAVLAAQGQLLESIEAYEALRQPMYRLTDNDWERARVALAARADASSHEFRAGPTVAVPSSPRARRSAIAFLDEQRLLLRGSPAQSYDLVSGELAPIGIAGDLALTDPSGRYALSAIVRSCQGYHLSIVEASRVALGAVAGANASEPLIAAAPPPPNARCPQLSPEQRRDDGGFRALAWTAQGVLLGRGQVLSLLALDASMHAAALASELPPSAALAGLPPHSSELSPDGRYHALITPLGVAIHDRQHGATRLVALPADAPPVSDVAVSPSGRRVAVVRGGRLLVGVPRETHATAAPGAAPPPAPSR